MAVTPYVYRKTAGHFAAGDINWASNTITAVLLTSSYTINVDTHEFASNLTNELSGGSYARKTLASKTSTLASNVLTLSAADLTWTSLTATGVRWVVFFKNTGTDSTSPLICANDFGTNYNPSAQDLAYSIGAGGIVTFTM